MAITSCLSGRAKSSLTTPTCLTMPSEDGRRASPLLPRTVVRLISERLPSVTSQGLPIGRRQWEQPPLQSKLETRLSREERRTRRIPSWQRSVVQQWFTRYSIGTIRARSRTLHQLTVFLFRLVGSRDLRHFRSLEDSNRHRFTDRAITESIFRSSRTSRSAKIRG